MDIEQIKKNINFELSTIKIEQDKMLTNQSKDSEFMELEGMKKAYKQALEMIKEVENG